jgi:hypothetical protein
LSALSALFCASLRILRSGTLRIPTEAGHLFRDDVGHRSDLIPATIPR